MLGGELHFILGLWLSSIFSNSSSACHSHISPLHPLCLLSYPLSHCLSHSCTHFANMCTDARHDTHTWDILYSPTPKHIFLWPMTHWCAVCINVSWLLLCAQILFNICCSFSHWLGEEEKYAPAIQLTFWFFQEEILHHPSQKQDWHRRTFHLFETFWASVSRLRGRAVACLSS